MIYFIIILITSITTIFILTCEFNRLQGSKCMSIISYYNPLKILLAPYTTWCALNYYGINSPFPNMKLNFPNHTILKNNWEKIRNEALHIYRSGNSTIIKGDMFFKNIADNGWKKFYIKWYGPITDESYSLCPITTKLIEQLPEIKLAMFSILEPGSKIKEHCGVFKGCIRYHLGLNCPKESNIIVDGIKYNWKNGKDILFDDTYLHEVKNESDDIRVILFCDVERKMKNSFSQKINNIMINLAGPLTTRNNNKLEIQTKI
jgi:beta-hydroxylase